MGPFSLDPCLRVSSVSNQLLHLWKQQVNTLWHQEPSLGVFLTEKRGLWKTKKTGYSICLIVTSKRACFPLLFFVRDRGLKITGLNANRFFFKSAVDWGMSCLSHDSIRTMPFSFNLPQVPFLCRSCTIQSCLVMSCWIKSLVSLFFCYSRSLKVTFSMTLKRTQSVQVVLIESIRHTGPQKGLKVILDTQRCKQATINKPTHLAFPKRFIW